MDKNEFFREATIRICGNLEIEQALFSTLVFLRNSIPIDIMFLEYFDICVSIHKYITKYLQIEQYQIRDKYKIFRTLNLFFS